jgi:uncharacterized protein YukE
VDTTYVIIQNALAAAGAGGAAFFGAITRFKKRVADFEDRLNKFSDRLDKFNDRLDHHLELDVTKENMRASMPDPLEDIRNMLSELREDIEKLKDRGARSVRVDDFTAFAREQEAQWKELAKTLGKLDSLLH